MERQTRIADPSPTRRSLFMLFAVMKELVRQKYSRGLYPEHPRALDLDRERGIRNSYPGGGGLVGEIYNVAYTKAMLQAALS